MEITNEILDKYNVPVPRYTSYPPANHFKDDYTSGDFCESLTESNNSSPRNISIYVHIPFCKKICFFCGCNKIALKEEELVRAYVDAVKKEIKMAAKYIDKSRRMSQVHYGGGTPNAIPAEYLREINEMLFMEFGAIDSPEIAIECNPANLDYEYIVKLHEAGFNRISMGIQDFDHEILKKVNREIPTIPIKEIFGYIKDVNPNMFINLDFIYGLPGQTQDKFMSSIAEAISLKPERLVTFSYAHVPWVHKAQKALEKIGLPSPDEKIQMYLASYKLLQEHGYKPIGLDHYVMEHDELYTALMENTLHRNFQGYCTRRTTGQVYAFGISSITQLEKAYFQNTKDIGKYIESINNEQFPIEKGYILNAEEMLIRDTIDNFMCNKKLDLNAFAAKMNISTEKYKEILHFDENSLTPFIDDGVIDFSNNTITVSERGILFIRNVAAVLDPFFKNQKITYSKAV